MESKLSRKKRRTTIYLPEDLHAEIRIEAVRKRISMTQLIMQAIQHYLPDSGRKTEYQK
jgi:predicted HicB family RNase H-like nuclease